VAWDRFRRYASWMREVHMDGGLEFRGNTLEQLRSNSPAGGWFPALQELSGHISKYTLPYVDLFLAPNLKKISIFVSSWSGRKTKVPQNALRSIASIFSALPASTLQFLLVGMGDHGIPWPYFKDSLSSVVLRCGPSLLEFGSLVPLSDEAITHLIQLPNLHTLSVSGPPPHYPASSLPLIFPPLTGFTLGEGAAREWLSLFKRIEDSVSTTQGMTPLSNVKGSLKSLDVENLCGLILNTSFFSQIRTFRNLVQLNIDTYCHDEHGQGQCNFKLNDRDVVELAMALSQLQHLLLGHPCFENTCTTTIACLLQISVHCVKLGVLGVHFNTANIVNDAKNVLEDPWFQELLLLPRSALRCLVVHDMPIDIDEAPDYETIAEVMGKIFPSLEHCAGSSGTWEDLPGVIAGTCDLS